MNKKQEKWIKKFGAENVYNKYCKHLKVINGTEYKCKIKCDMEHCGQTCVYATNVTLTNVVDRYGKVTGIRE